MLFAAAATVVAVVAIAVGAYGLHSGGGDSKPGGGTAKALAGTQWRLTEIHSADRTSRVPATYTAELAFSAGGQLNGRDGPNAFTGSYRTSGNRIALQVTAVGAAGGSGTIPAQQAMRSIYVPASLHADSVTSTFSLTATRLTITSSRWILTFDPIAASSPTTPTPTQTATARPCPAGTLSIKQGPRLSPETGEHGVIIAVSNASSTPCTVTGYPEVTLRNATSTLPFTYVAGKGQYVTHRQPRPVIVGGAKLAYFLVAKYRCDIGVNEPATGMNVLLPGQGTTYSVPTRWLRGAFDLCKGGTTPNGSTIMISPFEPATDRLAS
ncbi:MAG: DUF4232 domain-containing protein [Actinomycetota bacterium]|nr:DUF4232 domain-containing protein [Actinomycetota bacterium]